MKDRLLHRYWIEFESTGKDFWPEYRDGCGVTAYDREEALRLLQEKVFPSEQLPPVKRIVEDIDVSTLD